MGLQDKSLIVRWFILAFLLFYTAATSAAIVEDWGTIVTPLEEELTFDFEQYDITSNFTDEYTFALEGEADALYSVTFNMNYCTHGCGNLDTSYGIYDLNGNLVTTVSQDGTVILEAGDYAFQVKGTGFGAGNSLDYFGSVTFSSMVSAAPEPPAYLMMVSGLFLLLITKLREIIKKRRKPEAKPIVQPTQCHSGT